MLMPLRASRLLLFALVVACAKPDAAWRVPAGDAPPLVVLEHSYWGGGFDAPLFAALADGRVLMRRTSERFAAPTYSHRTLSREGLDSLLTQLGSRAVGELRDSLFDYNPGWTDQHSFYVLLATDSGQRVIQLRAALTGGDSLRQDVPAALRTLLQGIRQLASQDASLWAPDSIQVSIWPYEYAPDDPPLTWPAAFPSLDDRRWVREKNEFVEEVRTLTLPASAIPLMDSLARARRTRQALKIGPRRWAFDYRWVFPEERHWRHLASRLEG